MMTAINESEKYHNNHHQLLKRFQIVKNDNSNDEYRLDT